MPDDGGFERDLVNGINDLADDKNPKFHSYRRKQSRFAKQDIDVLCDSRKDSFYAGIECKSKQIDTEKASKDNNSSEAKLYFSDAFSVDKNDVHQIEHIQDFLNKTGRKGVLAIAYRRGMGRKVHYWALCWKKVWEKFTDDDCNGLTKGFVEENGVCLMNAETAEELDEMKRSEKETEFSKIFQIL